MSSFDCLKSPVLAGDAVPPVVAVGVQAMSAMASAAKMESVRRIELRIRLAGRCPRGGVLRLPLRRRGAEAFVVDVLGDGRMLSAGRARRIAAELDLAERAVE